MSKRITIEPIPQHVLRKMLAVAIYGDSAVSSTNDHIWIKSSVGAGFITFSPETNPEQAEKVEEWILKEHILHFTHRADTNNPDGYYISFQKAPQGRHRKSYFNIKHDGSVVGIRLARITGALTIIRQSMEQEND